MKNKISTPLKLIAVVLFSSAGVHSDSLLFTQAKAQCQANWYVAVNGGCSVTLINSSTGTNASTQYLWNFGNGQTATNSYGAVATYSASGTYNVCLTITNPVFSTTPCNDSICKPLTVQCGATGIAPSEQIDISLSVTNPVFSSSEIHYSIPSSGSVELVLFDIVGNKIRVLENGNKSAGKYSYVINTDSYAKGIYFLHLDFVGVHPFGKGATITKKIIIAE